MSAESTQYQVNTVVRQARGHLGELGVVGSDLQNGTIWRSTKMKGNALFAGIAQPMSGPKNLRAGRVRTQVFRATPSSFSHVGAHKESTLVRFTSPTWTDWLAKIVMTEDECLSVPIHAYFWNLTPPPPHTHIYLISGICMTSLEQAYKNCPLVVSENAFDLSLFSWLGKKKSMKLHC